MLDAQSESTMQSTNQSKSQVLPQRAPLGTVYFFLTTDCPISQKQFIDFMEIRRKVGNSFKFKVVFSGSKLTPGVADILNKKLSGLEVIDDSNEMGHSLAIKLKVTKVPDFVVEGIDQNVLYHGPLDSNPTRNPARTAVPYLLTSLADISNGRKPKPPPTSSVGCAIQLPRRPNQ